MYASPTPCAPSLFESIANNTVHVIPSPPMTIKVLIIHLFVSVAASGFACLTPDDLADSYVPPTRLKQGSWTSLNIDTIQDSQSCRLAVLLSRHKLFERLRSRFTEHRELL
ncbi:hypothetical protein J1614_011461 [Plenodomus biglobosus]|nr:hypothetical protein J1614_011461 [Plenodomus biglobosus]